MILISYLLKGFGKIIVYILDYACSDIGDDFKKMLSDIKNDIKNAYFDKIDENIKIYLILMSMF